MLFDGIVARKEGFVAYKNVILTQLNNLHFSKILAFTKEFNPRFWSKTLNFS